MKYQVLFSLENNENYLRMSSAAVLIGALRVNTCFLFLFCPIVDGKINQRDRRFLPSDICLLRR